MADNPPPQPPQQQPAVLPNIQRIGDLTQNINGILDIPLVEVRGNQPWINIARLGQQYLTIAGNNIAVDVKNINNIDVGDNFYRIRGQPVRYDINGPERIMVETRFTASGYSAYFSYGIIGCSGPQAEILVNAGRHLLYIIHPLTAIQLRNQFVSRSNHQSIVYQSMWSSTLISILSLCLYQWSAGNVNDDHIINLRLIIYRLGNRCIDLMRKVIQTKEIYQKAIVWVAAMNRLPLVNPEAPNRQILPIDVQPVPDIVVPNLQQSVNRITGFVNQVTQSPMFTRNWQQMFNEFANMNTSVPIIDNEEQKNGEEVLEQTVRLTNNQEFLVRVMANHLDENNEWSYIVNSIAFTDTYHTNYDVCPVVGDFEPLVVMRRLKPPAVNLPLHSHGLAGSYDDNIQGGNNGFQVTTLNFRGVDGLNHRRLYFANRAMAMELREMFEIVPNHPITVMTQYHQWFSELIHMSRLVCDLRQCYRQIAQQDIGGQWLLDIQHCAQRLFLLPRQLFLNYKIISRLEQLWNHSLLVPHIQNRESKVQPLKATAAMYSGKSSGNKNEKRKYGPKQSGSEIPQKIQKTK